MWYQQTVEINMSRGRPRNRPMEQQLYGDTPPREPSSSPVRSKKNPDVKRNKRIANAYGASMLKRPKKRNTQSNSNSNSNSNSSRSRSNSREPSTRPRVPSRGDSASSSSSSSSSSSRHTASRDPHKLYNQAKRPAKQQQNSSRGRRNNTQSKSPARRSRSTSQNSRPQKLPTHRSAEAKILAATQNSRSVNEQEADLDYESLQSYIDELKHKMQGTGGTASTVSVHQISKIKKRIFDAMTHEQKVAAMLKQGNYKPSSNLMKGAMPSRKKHVNNGAPAEPKHFTKKSAGMVYNQTLRGGSRDKKNQWGDWLDEFEAESLKWLEKNATYCRPGPASGNMQRAFNNFGDDEAGQAGDPYASLRGTILVLRRPKRRQLKPGQKIRRPKPKVRLGRDTIIRNDGRR